MNLADKFFSTFFYLLFFGIVSSIIISTIFLFYYSKSILDETTANNVYEVETKYARNNIYKANILLSDLILKVKSVLEEQLSYLEYAEKTLNLSESIENRKIKDVYSVWETPENNEELRKRIDYGSFWFVDPDTKNLTENEVLYNQIFLFSLLTQTMYAGYNSLNGLVLAFYFIFEDTEVFVTFPYKYYWKIDSVSSFLNSDSNPSWCTDKNGNIINYYKYKCRVFYRDIKKSKTVIFDNNVEDQKNRKIYITSPYKFYVGKSDEASFTLCIEFKYNISNTNAFICADIQATDVFNSFNKINEKLLGYFTISSVGFNKQFYFPNIISLGTDKTLGEYIFNWNINYYLKEKIEFLTNTQKQMISNYLKNYNETMVSKIDQEHLNSLNEIYIKNENKGTDQYFYVNNEIYEYSMYPIIFDNYQNEKEHLLTIIYIYKRSIFYKYPFRHEKKIYGILVLQIVLFVFFGSILLYIIILSFHILAKYIVIPIKNVQYMLEGINIGGEYRLEYLNALNNRKEDHLEKLKKINRELSKKNKENIITDLIEGDNNNINSKNINDFSNNKDNELTNKDNSKSNLILTEDNKNKNKKNLLKYKNDLKKEKEEDKFITSTDNDINLKENDNMNNIDYDKELIDPKIKYDK